ncbi:MAG: F-type H+-transporting ATPase subunit gamma [Pseudoalteromonas tetraodonis]|jgi:F-type H+-transporting ATPase subunit gamma
MANTRDIRRRIKSVKNTSQITRAMQLVAASKMKKAQDQALAGRRYAEEMNKVLVNLKEGVEDDAHALFEVREGNRELMIVITTDKGLCGGLNTNLLRKVTDDTSEDTGFVTVGNKGKQTLARLGRKLEANFVVSDPAVFVEVKAISKYATEQFLEGKIDKVTVAFTNFINTISQEPYIATLLPVSAIQMTQKRAYEGVSDDDDVSDVYSAADSNYGGYIFEPSPGAVLDNILPHYINYQLYQMMLEARASEHSARMVAMKAATDAADDMVKDLTLQFNKVRQAAITSELLEITTAMKALE